MSHSNELFLRVKIAKSSNEQTLYADIIICHFEAWKGKCQKVSKMKFRLKNDFLSIKMGRSEMYMVMIYIDISIN